MGVAPGTVVADDEGAGEMGAINALTGISANRYDDRLSGDR
jgi:hypothetical protein